jgi:hypothetical protein
LADSKLLVMSSGRQSFRRKADSPDRQCDDRTGYDGIARTISRHKGYFLSGNPLFAVQNIPGSAASRQRTHASRRGRTGETTRGRKIGD